MDNVIENEMEQVEVRNIIDYNDNVTGEEAMENACHDLNADMPRDEVPSSTPEPTMINYRNKSGRSIRRHNYRTINGNDIQMDQIKRMVTKENLGVLSKRLKKKFNKIKKDKIKKDNSKYIFKDIFRRLTGAMFSQISKGGRFILDRVLLER